MISDTLRRAVHHTIVKQKRLDDSIKRIDDKLDKIEKYNK